MTRLSYLHEPGVLWNIKSRYIFDDIYTYTGSILIAVNPFANLAHLYGPHMMDQYRGVDLGDLSPHVYAIADAAYRQMRKEFKGQSILVRTAPQRSLKQQQGLHDVQSLQCACQHMRSSAYWCGPSSPPRDACTRSTYHVQRSAPAQAQLWAISITWPGLEFLLVQLAKHLRSANSPCLTLSMGVLCCAVLFFTVVPLCR
jgi:hypothetical protein